MVSGMKTIFAALLKTILFVSIIATGMIVFFWVSKAINHLIENDYGIHAAMGFIILVFIFNYFHERKQQTGPQ